jgi:hypothetical protein
MSNQIILWSLIIVPWLTVFFLNKEDVKRYMPVALLATVTSLVVVDSGMRLNLWNVRETVYPLMQIIPYSLGLVPVVTIWIFKFCYKKVWLFIIVDTVFNLFFAFVFTPWLASHGIKDLITTSLTVFVLTCIAAALLYGYQMWQEEVLVRAERHEFSPSLQPAAKKDWSDSEDKKDEK